MFFVLISIENALFILFYKDEKVLEGRNFLKPSPYRQIFLKSQIMINSLKYMKTHFTKRFAQDIKSLINPKNFYKKN